MTEKRDLLVEIGTEELPPKALPKLVQAFEKSIKDKLQKAQIKYGTSHWYAAPRRFAVWLQDVAAAQPERTQEKRGPALQAAFDQEGKPTKAAEGFARSCGVAVSDLETRETDKGAWLYHVSTVPSVATSELLPEIITASLAELPISKRMRWANRDDEFVRPVHWILLLFGDQTIQATILGIETGNTTLGHRFHHPEPIQIAEPSEYVNMLQNQGRVMVDFSQRRATIEQQVNTVTKQINDDVHAHIDSDLLDEVTGLVEWPVALLGTFEQRFLNVPAEALISTMQGNQKYFPVFNKLNEIQPYFITVANIESRDPAKIQAGNERVIRPRFSDAEFFWQQDLAKPLEQHRDALKAMIFQHQLGSLADKSQRVAQLACYIAQQSGFNETWATRAAHLGKCDLLTNMVQEFAELQGIMGRYYAQHNGEPDAVAQALEEQYLPRYAGDKLPQTTTGQTLALAERLDTLVGIFAIGQIPTGNRDPFALRRAALGALRLLIELNWKLDLRTLLAQTANNYPADISAHDAIDAVFDFMMERLRSYYLDQGLTADTFEAVLACQPSEPVDFDCRIRALADFLQRPEAASLAAANKRIRNILKSDDNKLADHTIKPELLAESAEKTLAEHLRRLSTATIAQTEEGNYGAALSQLSTLQAPVDQFFDDVMVMSDDTQLRNNRIALLNQLSSLFLRIADISRIQS